MKQSSSTRGLLAHLRALRPPRHLSPTEARAIAERQATLLLKLTGITTPISVDVLTSVGRLRIERDHEIPNAVAGSSHWTGQEWLVCLNGNHPARRQRFTAFHELHHIIEHQVQRFENSTSAERLADHFSACVLMPRTAVKRAWCSGLQDIRRLADLFEVSEPAMRTRLVKLGLLDPSRHSCRRGRRRHHQPGWSHPFGTPGTEAQASTCGGSR